MSANSISSSIHVGARISADLAAKLDELCALTERSRSYWLVEALEAFIPRELEDVRVVTNAVAEGEAHPESYLGGADLDAWMIEHGVTSAAALAQARDELARGELGHGAL